MIEREPDLQGVYGSAWRVDMDNIEDDRPDAAGTLACFIVNAPTAHPLWDHWIIGLIHLRPIEGATNEPHKQFPTATHEIMFAALDPREPVPDPDRLPAPVPMLMPVDLVHQVAALTDEQARELFDLIPRAICELGESPDSDHRRRWATLIENTVEHIVTGGHGVTNN